MAQAWTFVLVLLLRSVYGQTTLNAPYLVYYLGAGWSCGRHLTSTDFPFFVLINLYRVFSFNGHRVSIRNFQASLIMIKVEIHSH